MAVQLPERTGWGPQPMLFDKQTEAWLFQRTFKSPYPFPLGGGVWAVPVLPPPPRPMPMSEYMAQYGPAHAPPSPGSAAEAAKLHGWDKPRIDEREARAAEKRRERAAKEAAAEAHRANQGSLFVSGR